MFVKTSKSEQESLTFFSGHQLDYLWVQVWASQPVSELMMQLIPELLSLPQTVSKGTLLPARGKTPAAHPALTRMELTPLQLASMLPLHFAQARLAADVQWGQTGVSPVPGLRL